MAAAGGSSPCAPAPPQPLARHHSIAWPLALGLVCLIAYASLYPFVDWRQQGMVPWAYLSAPWPRYWITFDVVANFLGYLPLGLLLTVGALRSGRSGWAAARWGVLGPALLSLLLESLQSYLPQRVPSQADVLLNGGGGVAGAVLALLLWRWRLLGSWSQFRQRWFVPHTGAGLVALLLWPWALLYPSSVPYGVGHVWPRLELALQQHLQDLPWALAWVPVTVPSLPLSPLAEAVVVALSLAAPLLLGYALLCRTWQRLLWALLLLGLAVGVAALSAALTYGPLRTWVWLTAPVLLGLCLLGALAVVALRWSHRACTVLMLLALTVALVLLNQAPESAYLAQSLERWQQDRFIRFHGLSQWLGWGWPFAVLWAGLRMALRPHGPTTIPAHD